MITLLYCNGTTSRLSGELATMRSCGISVVQNYQYPSISADVTDWLDACHTAGLKCLLSLFPITSPRDVPSNPNYTAINNVITQYDDHPAVYGYNIDDETLASAWGISSRIAVYDYIKARTSKPVHEVHWRVETGAYTPDCHDVYMLDVYPYIWDTLYTNPLPNLDTYLANEYSKLNPADHPKLMHIMQVYGWPGHGTGVVPPVGGVTGQWDVAKQNPNWNTAGIGFYTWLSSLDQTGATYDYPWETGNEHILSEMESVCASVLGAASVTVESVVGNTLTGTCSPGCYVNVGSNRAVVDQSGTSWSATVPAGAYTVTASNGITSASEAIVVGDLFDPLLFDGGLFDTGIKPLFDSAIFDGSVFDTGAASGGGTITGTANITLDALTQSAAGAVGIVGNASVVLGALTQIGIGYVGNPPVIGNASITLDPLTQSASGSVAITGSQIVTLGELISSAQGAVLITGEASIVLGALTQVATGTAYDGDQVIVTINKGILSVNNSRSVKWIL